MALGQGFGQFGSEVVDEAVERAGFELQSGEDGEDGEDVRRFLEQALEIAVDLRARSSVTIVRPGLSHWEIFLGLCQSADARGNLVPDAYHAALAIELGN